MMKRNELTRIDTTKREYHFSTNWNKQRITWEYAYDKTVRVAHWLMERGYSVIMPRPEDIGTPEGFRAYMLATDTLQGHYDILGEVCEVMLLDQLKGLEGKKLCVTDQKGRERIFWLSTCGKACPIHIECKHKPSKVGKRVTEHFKDVVTVPVIRTS